MKLNFFVLLYILCWCKVQPVDVCKYILLGMGNNKIYPCQILFKVNPGVLETSVTINNNSPIQDYVHPDDETQPNFISKSVEQTKKSRKILHHRKTQPPYFLKLPKQNVTNHLIFQPEFPVFRSKW